MPYSLFLDLYGVLADSGLMTYHYRQRMARILSERYGGSYEHWLEIHDEGLELLETEGEKLDSLPDEMREGDAWVRAVGDMEAENFVHMLKLAGLPPPRNPLKVMREVETEVVSEVNALYPDVVPTLRRLKREGHRLYLSTNVSRSNGESALIGGGIRDMFDDVILLEVGRAKKNRPYYWERAFGVAGVTPSESIVVDDVATYLAPPAELGARCIQMIRPDRALNKRGRFPIIDSLEKLPPYLKSL